MAGSPVAPPGWKRFDHAVSWVQAQTGIAADHLTVSNVLIETYSVAGAIFVVNESGLLVGLWKLLKNNRNQPWPETNGAELQKVHLKRTLERVFSPQHLRNSLKVTKLMRSNVI